MNEKRKETRTIWSQRPSDWIRAWQLLNSLKAVIFADLIAASVKRINIKTSFYEG